ncbi:MAG: hypothetical protein ACHQFZ_02755 [Acidimicrobiales bacterium]
MSPVISSWEPAIHGGPRLSARSAASTFCGKLPVTKVSAILQTPFRFFEATEVKSTLECIYFGKVATSTRGTEVVISKQLRMPASQVATLRAAEKRLASESPRDVKLVFTALPAVGRTAFSWSYQKPIHGGQGLGVANYKGTTGYGVFIGGQVRYFGAPSRHVGAAESLLILDMAT